jgi:hypothetical protein
MAAFFFGVRAAGLPLCGGGVEKNLSSKAGVLPALV